MFKKILAAAAVLSLIATTALAQSGILFQPGEVYGNSTASQRSGRAETVTLILDRALGSTRGAMISRGVSSWALVGPGALARAPFLSGGTGADVILSAFSLPASVTSGGVACFTSTSAMASSGALSSNGVVTGGGVGSCPSSTAAGTNNTVLHGITGGSPVFGAIVSADMNITATNCTNQFVSAISTGGVGTCSSITYASIASGSLATSAELEAGTASKLLSAAVIFDGEVTITFSATQTLDFNTFLNARITATANTTSLTCSNIKASQSGVITWVQDGTGSRTMVAGWCSQFRWANGTRGVLSTLASSIDTLFYQCISTTICYVSLSKAQAN